MFWVRCLGVFAFLGMGYGITKGKYAYKVREHLVRHPNVPKAFEGLKVVQLSDAHLGSFEGTPDRCSRHLKRSMNLNPM